MTNIVASVIVSLVTNMTSVTDEVRAPWSDSHVLGQAQPGSVIKHATWREDVTTVEEVKVLTFEWDGKPWRIESRKLVATTRKRFNLKQEWVEEK